jgi:tetratricopeptide (TPR) repeat protein
VAAGLDRPIAETEALLARMARRPDHIDAVGAATWGDGTVSTAYRFTHQLHREVIHDRTTVGRRIELHRRIGLALEEANRTSIGDLSAALADHFLMAGDRSRAAGHLRRVGAQALARQAPARAENVLEQALAECEQLAPGEERNQLELDIRLSLGEARVGVAGWFDPDVARHYERALVLADGLDSVDREAHARYALATISEMNGNFERTEELLTPVLTAGGEELEMEAHELVACSTFHQGAFGRSEENAGAVLETWPEDTASDLMARVAEHPATSCNSWMSLTNWFLGRSDESLRRAENAVRLGERHRYALAMATQQRAMLHQLRDEPERCREWADRTLALDRPLLSKVRRLQAEILRNWALAALDPDDGRASEAIDAMADAVGRFREAGVRLDGPYFIALHADAALRHGRVTDALALLDEAEERIDASTRTYFHRAEIQRLRARAILELDGPAARSQARAELDEALTNAFGMGSPPMALRVVCDRFELELDDGDPDPWRQRLTDLVGRYDGQVAPPDVVRGKSLLRD